MRFAGMLNAVALEAGKQFSFEVDVSKTEAFCHEHRVELWLDQEIEDRVVSSTGFLISDRYSVIGRKYSLIKHEMHDAEIHFRLKNQIAFPNVEIAFATAAQYLKAQMCGQRGSLITGGEQNLFYFGNEVLSICWDMEAPKSWLVEISPQGETLRMQYSRVFAFGDAAYHNHIAL